MNSNNNQRKTCKAGEGGVAGVGTYSWQTNFYQRTRIISIKKMSQVSKWKRRHTGSPETSPESSRDATTINTQRAAGRHERERQQQGASESARGYWFSMQRELGSISVCPST